MVRKWLWMGMSGQIVVYVFTEAMMFFTGCVQRVNVNCGIIKIANLMQNLVSHLFGNLVTFFNREFWTDRYIYFCMKPMT